MNALVRFARKAFRPLLRPPPPGGRRLPGLWRSGALGTRRFSRSQTLFGNAAWIHWQLYCLLGIPGWALFRRDNGVVGERRRSQTEFGNEGRGLVRFARKAFRPLLRPPPPGGRRLPGLRRSGASLGGTFNRVDFATLSPGRCRPAPFFCPADFFRMNCGRGARFARCRGKSPRPCRGRCRRISWSAGRRRAPRP